MSKELPPFEPPLGPELHEAAPAHRRRFNAKVIFGIGAFGMLALYLSLVVASQVDTIFFPARDLRLPAVLPAVDSGDNPEFADINQRTNILVLGLDQRRDEPDDTPARTDSIMILTMDPYANIGGAFSIPRDTWLDIPDGTGGSECAAYDAPSRCGYVEERINVAYEMGEYTYDDYEGGGAGLIKDTIEHNFNIPIDYYVLLNFNNFIDLIDELDGIDVDVPEYAYDPAYNDCNACYSYPVEFIEGPEHMDGERALAYARIRASDNDFKRIERQQVVVKATAQRAADLGTVFGNAVGLYKKYKDAVKTDISDLQIAGLADLARKIGPDNIRTVSMAEATYPCSYCNASVLLWDKDKVEELKAQVFSPQASQDDGASVKILNGTETPDLAAEFASFLRTQGITSDRLRTDELLDGPLYDTTIIVDLDGKTDTVDRLAEWLSLPAARIKTASDPEAADFVNSATDIIVVLGSDVELPGTQSANSSIEEDTSGG